MKSSRPTRKGSARFVRQRFGHGKVARHFRPNAAVVIRHGRVERPPHGQSQRRSPNLEGVHFKGMGLDSLRSGKENQRHPCLVGLRLAIIAVQRSDHAKAEPLVRVEVHRGYAAPSPSHPIPGLSLLRGRLGLGRRGILSRCKRTEQEQHGSPQGRSARTLPAKHLVLTDRRPPAAESVGTAACRCWR